MTKTKEHYISAAYADDHPDTTFPILASDYRRKFINQPVTNTEPPPERKVALVISLTRFDQMLGSSMKQVFGFMFDSALCLNNLNLSPQFIIYLKGLLNRVVQENHAIKHYGVNVGMFISKGSIEELKYVYTALKDICSEASKDVDVDFEIIQDEKELQIFLKNELFRIVHGDIKAAFDAISH